MKRIAILIPVAAFLLSSAAQAAGDLSRADPTEIVIEMGTSGDKMYFKPDNIELETGKAYKIVLKNVDDVKHEFEGHDFISKIFTRKVEITDLAGELVAEIKGAVTEVEVGPKREVEWFIVPVQTGEDIPVDCAIPGHKEAGMFGTITIK